MDGVYIERLGTLKIMIYIQKLVQTVKSESSKD